MGKQVQYELIFHDKKMESPNTGFRSPLKEVEVYKTTEFGFPVMVCFTTARHSDDEDARRDWRTLDVYDAAQAIRKAIREFDAMPFTAKELAHA